LVLPTPPSQAGAWERANRAESSKEHKEYWKFEWDTGRFNDLQNNQKSK